MRHATIIGVLLLLSGCADINRHDRAMDWFICLDRQTVRDC